MAQLAIKGHATRGKEVIEILRMIGGLDVCSLRGNTKENLYFVKEGYISHARLHEVFTTPYVIYTLEEFLKDFPYKVGDRVYYDNKVCDVIEMLWNSNLKTISYGVYDGEIKNLAIVEELKPYKETMEEIKDNWAKWDLPDGYEFQDKEGNIINTDTIKLVKKQPQYPKTYKECCKVLFPNAIEIGKVSVHGYFGNLLENFGDLLICRDAYWKIAGEGKPWKPDWKDFSTQKYSISDDKDKIITSYRVTGSRILVFPTEEMRDTFYNNFKELIERCKELL